MEFILSKFKDLIIDIQDQVESGELTFEQIADKYKVTLEFVKQVVASRHSDSPDPNEIDF